MIDVNNLPACVSEETRELIKSISAGLNPDIPDITPMQQIASAIEQGGLKNMGRLDMDAIAAKMKENRERQGGV